MLRKQMQDKTFRKLYDAAMGELSRHVSAGYADVLFGGDQTAVLENISAVIGRIVLLEAGIETGNQMGNVKDRFILKETVRILCCLAGNKPVW